MKEKNVNVVEETTETTTPVISTAYLVKEEDGVYLVDNGIKSENPVPITKDGICYALPVSSSNRKWYNIKKAEKEFAANNNSIYLPYKASIKLGAQGSKLPNEKLIAYLDEEDRAEYEAIIARARQAMAEDKVKPMTELEKAEAKVAKAKAAYEKLLAEANGNIEG